MRDKLLGNKKLMFAGAVVAGALLLGGVLVLTMKQPKIEQIKNEIILEAGTELQLDAKEFFETAEENYDKIKFEKESVDTRAVGDYEVKATFRDKEFLIKVKVQDTIAPEVTLKARHVYMSDLKAPVDIEYEYYDASEVSVTLAGTEKIQGLEDITEKKVKILTDIIKIPCDQEKLSKITSVTEEEGILRGVLKFEDACGNVQLEEILIVYDRPDGVEPSEKTEESDKKTEDKKEEGKKEENKDDKTPSDNKKPSSDQSSNTGSGDNGSGDTGNGGTQNPQTPSRPSEPEKPTEQAKPEIEAPESHITPAMQAAADAGYYKVIPTTSGGYVVMVKGDGEYRYGLQLLDEYLNTLGLERTGGYGCLISEEKNQYMCGVGADEYREKTYGDEPNSPGFWD